MRELMAPARAAICASSDEKHYYRFLGIIEKKGCVKRGLNGL
jgi:hypothetical protein